MRTIIGTDPHKSSLTAVDDGGAVHGTRRVTVNKGTGTALLKWAAAFEDLLFAVEGAKGLGRSIPQILVARNQAVVDVPATLSMQIRVLTTGGGHKTDPQDARAVALAALHHQGLHRVAAEDQDSVLGLLTQQRDALKSERTRLLNRLHQLFRELLDGGVPTGLTLARTRAAMKHVRPDTSADACRRDIAQGPHRADRPNRGTNEEIPGSDR
jgi:transposase